MNMSSCGCGGGVLVEVRNGFLEGKGFNVVSPGADRTVRNDVCYS